MKKRLLMVLLSVVMVIPVVCGFAGCNDDDYITVWVGDGMQKLTEEQIARFNETNTFGVTFNAKVTEVSESKAAGDATGNEGAADIFCFAQDQLARLVRYKVLSQLSNNEELAETIKERDDADSVASATLGDVIYAFPLTSDNAYFMYYDKRVVNEEHTGSLEEIISDVENYKDPEGRSRYFAMNLTDTGGAWYAASFFYATGCESEWPTDSNGKFTENYTDTIDSTQGRAAAKGMKKLLDSDCYLASDKASTFSAATPSGVVISGIWDYNTAKEALGENLGVAPLPSFNVDGQDYQLKSYLGHKYMGVKQQTDAKKGAYLKQLALYLTGEECQRERFEKVGWKPSNKNLQADEEITSPALGALALQETIPQGQYPTDWWTVMTALAQGIKNVEDAENEDSLFVPFDTYRSMLPGLLTSMD